MASLLVRKFKDTVGRIVTVSKDVATRKYTIHTALYDRQGTAISLMSFSFPNRERCMKELRDKYKRETRPHLK